jgi:hypothetical protein
VTIDHLLDHIIAPGLQDLRIHGDIDHILPFLHKSACALRQLTLFQCIEKDTNVIRLIHGIPSLTTLAIDFRSQSVPANRALILALTIRPSDSNTDVEYLCPNLFSFSWGDRQGAMDHPAFVQMVDMLRSRSRNARGHDWTAN